MAKLLCSPIYHTGDCQYRPELEQSCYEFDGRKSLRCSEYERASRAEGFCELHQHLLALGRRNMFKDLGTERQIPILTSQTLRRICISNGNAAQSGDTVKEGLVDINRYG